MKCYAVNDWDPLKSVALGSFMDPKIVKDIFNHSFYKDFLPIAQRLADETWHDLNVIQQKLEDLGVEVIRPNQEVLSTFQLKQAETLKLNLDTNTTSIAANVFMGKIPIPLAPRNDMMVYKDIIFTNGDQPCFIDLDQFENKIVDAYEMDWGYVHWPAVTRVNDRLVFGDEFSSKLIDSVMSYFPDSTFTSTDIRGHVDASLACIKEGVLLTTERNADEVYEETFPGWKTIPSGTNGYRHMCNQLTGYDMPHEEIINSIKTNSDNKWHIEGFEKQENADKIAEVINKTLSNWFGYSEETYFEVNCLTINPELSLVIGDSDSMRDELKKVDHEIISVDWRNRWFFDQGLHCLTQDLIRTK